MRGPPVRVPPRGAMHPALHDASWLPLEPMMSRTETTGRLQQPAACAHLEHEAPSFRYAVSDDPSRHHHGGRLTSCEVPSTLGRNRPQRGDSHVPLTERRSRQHEQVSPAPVLICDGETDEALRVVLADDHHFFREGMGELLAEQGVAVVGEATNGTEAITLTRKLKPDVVVIDLKMPGLSGVEAIRHILAATPSS